VLADVRGQATHLAEVNGIERKRPRLPERSAMTPMIPRGYGLPVHAGRSGLPTVQTSISSRKITT